MLAAEYVLTNSQGRILALAVGAGVMILGAVLFSKLGSRLTTELNKLYVRLPGRFQYPAWFHRLIGGIFLAFGLVFVLAGLLHSN